MNRIKVVCLDQTSAGFLRSKLGKILTVLILVAAAAAASATTSLSGVSCGSAAYSAAATDPCSVYLMAKTNKKSYVTLSSNNPAVTVPSAVMVKPGSLSTGFNAVVAGVTTAQTATVTAQADGVVKTFSITLSPATTGTPALSFSATSLAFGNVSLGTAISKSVTVTSSGTAAVTINSDSISGTGFSVSGGSFPAVLSPGQAIVLSVQFNPSIAGSVTGQLTIASNASTTYVSLSGSGIVVAPTLSALSCSGSSFTGSGTANCSSTAPSGGQPVTLGSNETVQ